MTVKLNSDNGLQTMAERTPAGNGVLPQCLLTCKIEAECSYQTLYGVYSEVLRNRQLWQHAIRAIPMIMNHGSETKIRESMNVAVWMWISVLFSCGGLDDGGKVSFGRTFYR